MRGRSSGLGLSVQRFENFPEVVTTLAQTTGMQHLEHMHAL